jgi:hypothetical protein
MDLELFGGEVGSTSCAGRGEELGREVKDLLEKN